MSAASLPLPLLQRAHGVPNWVDLHTTQPERACVFYEQILGWTLRRPPLSAVADRPASSPLPAIDETPSRSSLALVDGEGVAEVVGRGAGDELSLLPSSWFPYVAVDDLDAALDLVEPAGGLVLSSAATRDDGARVATILDQADAVLRLWEPAKQVGAPVVGQPGSLSWIELETNDLDGARKFYGELFDWDSGEVDDPGCG
ncbi:MAG: VOC family protein, partial [Actinomycetota bacterium]